MIWLLDRPARIEVTIIAEGTRAPKIRRRVFLLGYPMSFDRVDLVPGDEGYEVRIIVEFDGEDEAEMFAQNFIMCGALLMMDFGISMESTKH